MAYLKPQSPLQKGADYIYPLTTADQVIINENGTRLGDGKGNLNGGVFSSAISLNVEPTEANHVITKQYVDNILAGCWIEFTDENGNPTNEPYIHWMTDANGNLITTGIPFAEDGEY